MPAEAQGAEPAHTPARSGRSAHLPIDDALAPFADLLRQHLPTPDEIEQAAAHRRHARTGLRGASAATLTAVALVAVAALLWADPALQRQSLATAVGERSTVVLADGSELRLNTASRVEVAQHLRSRRLTLTAGEAAFNVAHTPWHAALPWLERPFTVAAGGVVVQDIGTVFTVRHEPSAAGSDAHSNSNSNSNGNGNGNITVDVDTTVTVLQGRVRVHSAAGNAAPVDLSAGQSLRAGRDPTRWPAPQALNPLTAGAWREGRLVLDATPLADAVAEMQRHRRAPIVLADRDAGALRISGQFDLDRLDQLIDLLPRLAPVRVDHRRDGGVEIASRHEHQKP